jgi:hypothetical protein
VPYLAIIQKARTKLIAMNHSNFVLITDQIMSQSRAKETGVTPMTLISILQQLQIIPNTGQQWR